MVVRMAAKHTSLKLFVFYSGFLLIQKMVKGQEGKHVLF